MKKDTKYEIMQTAKKLFNERGYNNVSTQNISDSLNISKGNLTYHFKRKEDIIEAIVEEMHSHYKKPDVPTTLTELNDIFIRVQNVAIENAFYFWHYTQLGQLSEKIKEIQNTVIKNQYDLFNEAFEMLYKNNFLVEEYTGQHKQLTHIITLTCIYWKPHSELVANLQLTGDFLNCLWAIIYPILTEKGKLNLKKLQE